MDGKSQGLKRGEILMLDLSKIRAYAYANSPFVDDSIEDNAYRDGVDEVLTIIRRAEVKP